MSTALAAVPATESADDPIYQTDFVREMLRLSLIHISEPTRPY